MAAGLLLSHDLALGFALGFVPWMVIVRIVCVVEVEFRVWFGAWCPGAGLVLALELVWQQDRCCHMTWPEVLP